MKRMPRFRNIVIAVVVALIGLIWFGIASPDQDWLWFVPVFNEEPSRIHLYRDGEQIVLQPGDPRYQDVNHAINQIVRKIQAKESLTLSGETQQEYYDQFSAVEVFYREPVIIHTRHSFPTADKLLFPRSGPYDDASIVFAGYQRRADYRRGVLVLDSCDTLDAAVDAVWAAQE